MTADLARLTTDAAPPAAAAPNDGDALGLTRREGLVLDLLAQGRTNGQIGTALYISTRTASVHVSAILRKLGVANRVEAAALAYRATPAGRATWPAEHLESDRHRSGIHPHRGSR